MVLNESYHGFGFCPLHIQAFGALNRQSPRLDATLLLSKLCFHQQRSEIQREGQRWVIRTREQMAQWLSCSVSKIDRLLRELAQQGLLNKAHATWYGKKALRLSVSTAIAPAPVNFRVLNDLVQQVGSIESALIFSRVLFALAHTRIQHENKRWCVLSRQSLADWLGLSLRTIDARLQHLESLQFLEKRTFHWQGKPRVHFHIPADALKALTSYSAATTPACRQICRSEGANLTTSIRRNKKEKKTNNNITTKSTLSQGRVTRCDMNVKKAEDSLTARQVAYLKGALANTQSRYCLSFSHPNQVWDELVFSLSSPFHKKTIHSFQHGVSRAMRLLSQGRITAGIGCILGDA